MAYAFPGRLITDPEELDKRINQLRREVLVNVTLKNARTYLRTINTMLNNGPLAAWQISEITGRSEEKELEYLSHLLNAKLVTLNDGKYSLTKENLEDVKKVFPFF